MTEWDMPPLLNIRECSHGKRNDGGVTALQEGSAFMFPGCGRLHYATRDLYPVDENWIAEYEQLKVMQARAAKARAARFGEDDA